MYKVGLLGLALCAFLMGALPAWANITANLEEPAEGPVSGVRNIRGWAFATNLEGQAVPVTVRSRLDGVTGDEIPCCVPRQDVRDAVEGAPLETGFSAQINYGILTEGAHTIGVEITAEGCDPMIIDRSVRVVKLGGKEFVTGLDLSGASVSVEGNRIVISGATVSDEAGSVEDTFTLEFGAESQSLNIVGSSVSGGTAVTAYTANLTGDQEVPPVNIGAAGAGSAKLNPDGSVTFFVEARGLSGPPTAAHIHMASAGNNGMIIVDLGDPITTEEPFMWTGTSDPLTEDQVDALRNGGLYFNVHTDANPPGEIRGQIVAVPGTPCADPSRNIFVKANPPNPGARMPTPNQGCRLLSEDLCGQAWQFVAGDPAFGPVSCNFFPDFGVCAGCGPNVEPGGACVNSCVAP